MGENFVDLGRELGDAFVGYWVARTQLSETEIDEAAEYLYRTWMSLPMDPDAEWTEEEARENRQVQALQKDGQT